MQDIKTFSYNDIELGHEESFQVSISEEILRDFRKITGDINPLHMEDTYAYEMGYTSHIAYGMLTASFLSTLAGVFLPGKYSLIQEVEVKLVKPVLVGDILTVKGVVSEKQDSFKRIIIKVNIFNQDGVKVLRGNMKVGVMK